MNLCHLVVVVAVLWTSNGEAKPLQDKVSNRQHKIVRKQQVPIHIRKQYIDIYGGNSVMGNQGQGLGGSETEQSYMEGAENTQMNQPNIANTLQGAGISMNNGLTQNDMGGGQIDSMSSDLIDSTESTDGRQVIGNGLMQGGGGLDISQTGGSSNLGAGIGGGLSAGLGGGGLDGGLGDSLEGGLGGGLGGGGLGGGGLGGAHLGQGGLGGASLGGGGLGGGTIDIGGGVGAEMTGSLSDDGLGGGGSLGGGIGGAGLGGGSIGTIGGGSLGDSGIGGGSLGKFGGSLGEGDIDESSLDGNIGTAGLNSIGDLGGGLGDNLGGDSLAGLGGNNGGSITDGIGLEALGSRIAAGSKAQTLASAGLGGAHVHHMGFAGLGGPGGMLGGMQTDHQTPVDMQLSDAADENPSMMHQGLTSILPGKTVHAHVSDKPTGNRPAVTGPSMNAALQVQMEAKKQHQNRLQKLKLKLKKLRERLETLQSTGNKQNTISSKQDNVNTEEIDTLNELRMATQDAIKELHTDYPHAKKHNKVQRKHESLGSKLKTVDFTAKETGDTLEELLRLLDPELQDKKRGQVNGSKGKNSRLDEEAESKLASLAKKAEDEVENEVDKLTSENSKPKTDPQAKVTNDKETVKVANKIQTPWKGRSSQTLKERQTKESAVKNGRSKVKKAQENIKIQKSWVLAR